MDLKKYDELRKKIHTKDFEGRNKTLDSWLYKLSFLGNLGSIFFAYFLVFPALKKAISANLINGSWGSAIAIIITIAILLSFEAIKRILIKNFSFDLVKNQMNVLHARIVGWFIFSLAIIGLSVYLSLNGAKNFASTSTQKNIEAKDILKTQVDSLNTMYEGYKLTYVLDNEDLRKTNSELRDKMTETEVNYRTVRNDLQKNIDNNNEMIAFNEEKINELDVQLKNEINVISQEYLKAENSNEKEDFKNIFLFIIISASIEILIVVGVYFREYYEYNLYVANEDRLEKVYKKRDRYRSMLAYIYQEGKVQHGARIMAAAKLMELIQENTTIADPKKFVETFLRDMENLGIFVTQGKRRLINASYQEALNVINNFDDALRILENLK